MKLLMLHLALFVLSVSSRELKVIKTYHYPADLRLLTITLTDSTCQISNNLKWNPFEDVVNLILPSNSQSEREIKTVSGESIELIKTMLASSVDSITDLNNIVGKIVDSVRQNAINIGDLSQLTGNYFAKFSKEMYNVYLEEIINKLLKEHVSRHQDWKSTSDFSPLLVERVSEVSETFHIWGTKYDMINDYYAFKSNCGAPAFNWNIRNVPGEFTLEITRTCKLNVASFANEPICEYSTIVKKHWDKWSCFVSYSKDEMDYCNGIRCNLNNPSKACVPNELQLMNVQCDSFMVNVNFLGKYSNFLYYETLNSLQTVKDFLLSSEKNFWFVPTNFNLNMPEDVIASTIKEGSLRKRTWKVYTYAGTADKCLAGKPTEYSPCDPDFDISDWPVLNEEIEGFYLDNNKLDILLNYVFPSKEIYREPFISSYFNNLNMVKSSCNVVASRSYLFYKNIKNLKLLTSIGSGIVKDNSTNKLYFPLYSPPEQFTLDANYDIPVEMFKDQNYISLSSLSCSEDICNLNEAFESKHQLVNLKNFEKQYENQCFTYQCELLKNFKIVNQSLIDNVWKFEIQDIEGVNLCDVEKLTGLVTYTYLDGRQCSGFTCEESNVDNIKSKSGFLCFVNSTNRDYKFVEVDTTTSQLNSSLESLIDDFRKFSDKVELNLRNLDIIKKDLDSNLNQLKKLKNDLNNFTVEYEYFKIYHQSLIDLFPNLGNTLDEIISGGESAAESAINIIKRTLGITGQTLGFLLDNFWIILIIIGLIFFCQFTYPFLKVCYKKKQQSILDKLHIEESQEPKVKKITHKKSNVTSDLPIEIELTSNPIDEHLKSYGNHYETIRSIFENISDMSKLQREIIKSSWTYSELFCYSIHKPQHNLFVELNLTYSAVESKLDINEIEDLKDLKLGNKELEEDWLNRAIKMHKKVFLILLEPP